MKFPADRPGEEDPAVREAAAGVLEVLANLAAEGSDGSEEVVRELEEAGLRTKILSLAAAIGGVDTSSCLDELSTR